MSALFSASPLHDGQSGERAIHRCVRCRAAYPRRFRPWCGCGGMIDIDYEGVSAARFAASDDPLRRYAPLIPVLDPASFGSLRLASTPCERARALGERLGMNRLYLKNESVLPTGTTKDRMAAVAIAYLRECGVTTFCASSTGNSSTAFAYAVARVPDVRMFLFTAEHFASRVQHTDHPRVVHFVLRDASFVEATECAVSFARRHGLVSEGGFFNPGRREGLKLAFLEASEQVPAPIDWYVQAVSSAMGVYGAFKGARELRAMGRIDRLPRLLCVQQESCAPMVRAFEEGSDRILPRHVVARPSGIATAILRGDPTRAYPYVRSMVTESAGTFAAVSEAEIRDARTMLLDLEGIDVCFSSACALAGVVRLRRAGVLGADDCVVVNLTGSNRPARDDGPPPIYLRRDGEAWTPEAPTDPRAAGTWVAPMEALGR